MTTPTASYQARRKTSGWVIFAGVITLIAAATNLIFGLAALINDDWAVLTPEQLVIFDLTTVGVIYLAFAAFQFFVAIGIFAGELWARVLGIIGASLNIIAQMAFMSLYPAWSWLVIIVDALVIYGLTVHGDEVAEI